MKIKEFIQDKLDDIKWHYNHYRYAIKNFFVCIGRWFSYWKVCRRIYDFDSSGILDVEYHQIKRTRDSIIKNNHHVDWEHDVWTMNIALKLLEIIAEDGCAKWVGERQWYKDDNGHMQRNMNGYYELPVYVNTRNYKRFLPRVTDEDIYGDNKIRSVLIQDGLRLIKAKNLYYEWRKNYTFDWWD